jgi:serine/threonine-protein kinase
VPDLTGEIIDNRYQLLRVVGSGGMATIYAALDVRLDRSVAVKIMHPHLANDEEFVNRFIREAKATAALSHPNIVAIQDQGWNEGGVAAVFIVMELIDGFTLRDVIHDRGALPVDEALRFFAPVVSAVAAAHKIGILHRDIKPENVLISKDGRVKIADFGLARNASLGETLTAESSVVLGSVSYLSPEQVQRGISDSRSDVYALGIVLFELLTGVKPFEGESPIQIAYRHVNENIPAPTTLIPNLPPELDAMVLRATANNPDKRFLDAGSLQDSLQALMQLLDPKRRQLSLELDIPIQKSQPEKKKRSRFQGIKNITTSNDFKKIVPARERTNTTKRAEPAKRENSAATKRKLSKRVKRNRAIASLIVLALIFGGYQLIAGGGDRISVPSMAGATQGQATKSLAALGLKVDVTDQVFSEDVPAGKVISSNPGGGGKIGTGGTVHLTISKGPDRIKVPALAGLTLEAATAALTAAGLKVGRTTQSFSVTRDKDLIISSAPPFKSDARKDAVVDLVVSLGIQQLTINSYVGKTSDEALNELTAAGVSANATYAYSDSVQIGTVISQSPDGAAPLAKGSVVTLVISKGPSAIYVPNVYSLTQLKATTILENLGLKVVVRKIGTKKVKTVTNVSPASGAKVSPGATITITLG